MCDDNDLNRSEEEMLLDALQRTNERDQKRGHATYWNADRHSQRAMELYTVRTWAEALNRRGHHIDVGSIRKNSEAYPDCLAENCGGTIGVEVTELVNSKAIKEHKKLPELAVLESDRFGILNLLVPIWDLDTFRKALDEIVRKKDLRVRDSSLMKQLLLIVTDEPWLDEATVWKYLTTIRLRRPNHFDHVFLMLSYHPDGDGNGRYPLFEIQLQD